MRSKLPVRRPPSSCVSPIHWAGGSVKKFVGASDRRGVRAGHWTVIDMVDEVSGFLFGSDYNEQRKWRAREGRSRVH